MYFEIVRAKGGYRAHARGANHEIVWWTEVYVRKEDARLAVSLLKGFAASAPVHDHAVAA